MDSYITQMLEFVREHHENEENDSLLERFVLCYRMDHPLGSEDIREKFRAVDPIMKSLSKKKEICLVHTMLEICEEREHFAFLEGIRIGAQLMIEMKEL